MFSDTVTLFSVADGEAIPLSEVPDEAFASGMLGEGFAVRPANGTIYSPVRGTVEGITETRHAYNIRSEGGLEILVHIGVDTVNLNGDGFTPAVQIGDRVEAGDVIARVDMEKIRQAGCGTVTPVLVSNAETLTGARKKLKYGAVQGGRSAVMKIQNKSNKGRQAL